MPGLFDPGKDWTYLQERTFALIGPAATREALDRLGEAGMREALLRSRDLLATPSTGCPRSSCSPIRWACSRSSASTSPRDRRTRGARRESAGYVSADGRSRLVIATPAGPPFDNAFCRRLFERLDGDRDGSPQRGGRREARSASGAEYSLRRRSPDRGRDRGDHETGGHAQQRDVGRRRFCSCCSLVFRSAWLFVVAAIPMSVAIARLPSPSTA